MRFLRLKLGLSQEKFAQTLGIKRGRLAPYEDKSSGDPEFYRKMVDNHNINLHKFLIEEMNDDNYWSFFTTIEDGMVEEPEGTYFPKSGIIDIVQQMKSEEDVYNRNQLADQAISMIAKLMDENSQLRNEMLELLKSRKD